MLLIEVSSSFFVILRIGAWLVGFLAGDWPSEGEGLPMLLFERRGVLLDKPLPLTVPLAAQAALALVLEFLVGLEAFSPDLAALWAFLSS